LIWTLSHSIPIVSPETCRPQNHLEYEEDDECKGDEEVVTPKSDLNNNKKESDLTVSEISKGIEGI